MKKCVDMYLHLAPKGTKLKKVHTPFRRDTPGPHLRPYKEGPWHECPCCRGRYAPEDFKKGGTRKPMPKSEWSRSRITSYIRGYLHRLRLRS